MCLAILHPKNDTRITFFKKLIGVTTCNIVGTLYWLYTILCGMDRLGIAVYSLLLIVYSLQLISWLFADNLQISCGFLGGFEEKACFCGRSVKYRRN